MAKIKEFIKGNGSISSRISEVDCVYNIGVVKDEKYITLSTYGSVNRKNGGTASQVIHIDKNSAKKLVEILCNEFNIKG